MTRQSDFGVSIYVKRQTFNHTHTHTNTQATFKQNTLELLSARCNAVTSFVRPKHFSNYL